MLLHKFGDDAVVIQPSTYQTWLPYIQHDVGQTIDFSPDGWATRWFPLGKSNHVQLSPSVGFGAPTVAGRSIKTANVYDLFIAERRDLQVVADWFSITPDEAKDAIEWEAKQQKAA